MRQNTTSDFDEILMLVLGITGLALTAFFLAMPALRVYYAVIMPAVIAVGAFTAWGLLYVARTGAVPRRLRAARPATEER